MNEFQRNCIAEILVLFKELKIPEPLFKEIEGRSEQYYLARAVSDGRSLDIYVYEDEVGMMVDEKWTVCEKPDSRSFQELIKQFSGILRETLSPPHC